MPTFKNYFAIAALIQILLVMPLVHQCTGLEKFLHIPILINDNNLNNNTKLIDTLMRAFQREEILLPQQQSRGGDIDSQQNYVLKFRPTVITASSSSNYMVNVKRLCAYADEVAAQKSHKNQHALLSLINLVQNEAAAYASATFASTLNIPLLEYTTNYDVGETQYHELFRRPNKRITLSANAAHVATSISQLISNQQWNNTFALLTDMSSFPAIMFREQFEHLFGRYWLRGGRAFSIDSTQGSYVTQLLQKLRRGGTGTGGGGAPDALDISSHPKQYLILFGSERMVDMIIATGERLYRDSINAGEKITPFTYIVCSSLAKWAADMDTDDDSAVEQEKILSPLRQYWPADRVLTFAPATAALDLTPMADFVPVAIASSLSMLTSDELQRLFDSNSKSSSSCYTNNAVNKIPTHYLDNLSRMVAQSPLRGELMRLYIRKLDYVRAPTTSTSHGEEEEKENIKEKVDEEKVVVASVRRKWLTIGHITPNDAPRFYADAFENAGPLFMPLVRAHRPTFTIATMRSPPFVDLDFTYADFDGSVTCHHGVECIEPNLTATAVKNKPYPENLLTILAHYKQRTLKQRSSSAPAAAAAAVAAYDAAAAAAPQTHTAGAGASGVGTHKEPHVLADGDNQQLYTTRCCHGLSIDLLMKLSDDLEFDHLMYIVPPVARNPQQSSSSSLLAQETAGDQIVRDLQHGAAHMAFTSLSITKKRERVVDFSLPYFYNSFSSLKWAERKSVKLSAFLEPFSIKLWLCIFAALHTTGITAAVFEWISPFGLNPWGRQRAKNFSLATALTTVYSLFFNHVIAFKAPKSWPNKVLINFWGSFCFVVLASYTANFAAIYAGIDQRITSTDIFADLAASKTGSQRIGVVGGSTAESYIKTNYPAAYARIKQHAIFDLAEGVEKLHTGQLQLIVYDEPLLRYVAAMDPKCRLRRAGRSFGDEGYAVGLSKQFPLRDTLSLLILKYMREGYLDDLQATWFGHLPCEGRSLSELIDPRQLGFDDFAGVFLLLAVGVALGTMALTLEHIVYRFLPRLRSSPSDSVWRNRHIMFVSQKLYRFINQVELVSPNMAAKEMAASLKQGQFIGMFQKSVKKKAREQQLMQQKERNVENFFEMVRDLTRMQRESIDTNNNNTSSDVEGGNNDSAYQPPILPKSLSSGILTMSTIVANSVSANDRVAAVATPTSGGGGFLLKPLVEEDEEASRRSSLASVGMGQQQQHQQFHHMANMVTLLESEKLSMMMTQQRRRKSSSVSAAQTNIVGVDGGFQFSAGDEGDGAGGGDSIELEQKQATTPLLQQQLVQQVTAAAAVRSSPSTNSLATQQQQQLQSRRSSRPLLELVGKQERINDEQQPQQQLSNNINNNNNNSSTSPPQQQQQHVSGDNVSRRSRNTSSIETNFSIAGRELDTATTQSSSGGLVSSSFERSTTSNSEDHQQQQQQPQQPLIPIVIKPFDEIIDNRIATARMTKNSSLSARLSPPPPARSERDTLTAAIVSDMTARRRSVAGGATTATSALMMSAQSFSPSSLSLAAQSGRRRSSAAPPPTGGVGGNNAVPAAAAGGGGGGMSAASRRASAASPALSLQHSALSEWSDEQLATLSKQDLLNMWQSSECDLRTQMQRLERDKANLELKLATQYEQRLRSRRTSKDWV